MGINCLLSVVAGGATRESVVSVHHPGGRKEVREPGNPGQLIPRINGVDTHRNRVGANSRWNLTNPACTTDLRREVRAHARPRSISQKSMTLCSARML